MIDQIGAYTRVATLENLPHNWAIFNDIVLMCMIWNLCNSLVLPPKLGDLNYFSFRVRKCPP